MEFKDGCVRDLRDHRIKSIEWCWRCSYCLTRRGQIAWLDGSRSAKDEE